MNNITLITSIINTPNIPLSHTNIRSVYNREQRFEQLKKTIETIREKIPNNKIVLVECSEFFNDEMDYLKKNIDIILNIYETKNYDFINKMFTKSKSMGEGTMTIFAIQYLINNNIKFNNLFKISGRYWLNSNFDYEIFNNNLNCVSLINNDKKNVLTCFYKLSNEFSNKWLNFLLNSNLEFEKCLGFEEIFANFVNEIFNSDFKIIEKIGLNGYVSVCGTFIEK